MALGRHPALLAAVAAAAEHVALHAGMDEPAQRGLAAAAQAACRDRFAEVGAAVAGIEVRVEDLSGRVEITFRHATIRRRTELPNYPQVDEVETKSHGGTDIVRLIKRTRT
jgi:hypothetical protein